MKGTGVDPTLTGPKLTLEPAAPPRNETTFAERLRHLWERFLHFPLAVPELPSFEHDKPDLSLIHI